MNLLDTLHALLFVAAAPVALGELAQATGMPEGQIEQGLELLAEKLDEKGPFQLVHIARGYQICTKPELAEVVSAFLKPQRQRLSRSLMEVLAIVAYKQPITQAEIDAIRGAQSDYGVKGLLERRLVREVGRRQTAGRPFLYGTTDQFLHLFKLSDISALPTLAVGLPVLQIQEGGLAC